MKRLRRATSIAFRSLLILIFVSAPVLAAESTESDPLAASMGTFFKWLNFVIVFGGIIFLIRKYGESAFRANAQAIAAKITEAAEVKAQADRELSEVTAKIANFDREVAAMRETSAREAAAEAARLREAARVEIEKIKQAAHVELIAAERAAHQEVRALAASMAVERAGVVVTARMNPEIRARLFRNFLGEVERTRN
jgi:F0F1-type ATP synthase membrane subunit b/b'